MQIQERIDEWMWKVTQRGRDFTNSRVIVPISTYPQMYSFSTTMANSKSVYEEIASEEKIFPDFEGEMPNRRLRPVTILLLISTVTFAILSLSLSIKAGNGCVDLSRAGHTTEWGL